MPDDFLNEDLEDMFIVASEAINDVLDVFALKKEPENGTLESFLMAYTKEKLIKLADFNGIDVKKSWNKDRLVSVVGEGFRDSLEDRLLLFGYDKLLLMKQLTDGEFAGELVPKEMDFYVSVYRQAVYMGIIYSVDDKEDVSFSIPTEFKEVLDDVVGNYEQFEKDNQSKIEFWDQMNDVLTASVNLYGVVTIDRIIKLWEIRFPKMKPTVYELGELVERQFRAIPLLAIRNGYYFLKNIIIASHNFRNEAEVLYFYYVYATKMSRDYFKPTKEEIKYFSEHPFDRRTSYYKKLKYTVSKTSPEPTLVMKMIEWSILIDLDFGELMNEFHDLNILFFESEKQVKQFSDQYFRLVNNSRLWQNGGYTPIEMDKKFQQENRQREATQPDNIIPLASSPEKDHSTEQPKDVEKVGRNDPCPCGSGKKYKKCCWKKNQRN